MASWADGLITAAASRDRMRGVVDAFRERSGGKPIYLQSTLSFAPTDAAAEAAALDQWRHCGIDTQQLAELRSPDEFDRAADHVSAADVLTIVRASRDIERHIDWLHQDAELGFERIYLHNVARSYQAQFIEACGSRLLPAFARPRSRRAHLEGPARLVVRAGLRRS